MDKLMAIKILLVDEHLMFLETLAPFFGKVDGLEVVGIAESGVTALQKLDDLQPDVVVLGINLLISDGCEFCQEVNLRWPDVKVLVLSSHDNQEVVLRFMKSGARGYLTKSCAFSELSQAITIICSGNMYLSPRITDRVLTSLTHVEQSPRRRHDTLTSRELEVARLIAKGGNTKQIAWKLSISSKTVESHRTNIMNKLGLDNIAGLVHYALREGLLPGE
jgi:DNA-binding NarL/FixJ family response regulator